MNQFLEMQDLIDKADSIISYKRNNRFLTAKQISSKFNEALCDIVLEDEKEFVDTCKKAFKNSAVEDRKNKECFEWVDVSGQIDKKINHLQNEENIDIRVFDKDKSCFILSECDIETKKIKPKSIFEHGEEISFYIISDGTDIYRIKGETSEEALKCFKETYPEKSLESVDVINEDTEFVPSVSPGGPFVITIKTGNSNWSTYAQCNTIGKLTFLMNQLQNAEYVVIDKFNKKIFKNKPSKKDIYQHDNPTNISPSQASQRVLFSPSMGGFPPQMLRPFESNQFYFLVSPEMDLIGLTKEIDSVSLENLLDIDGSIFCVDHVNQGEKYACLRKIPDEMVGAKERSKSIYVEIYK